jgi:phospholipase C
MFIRKIPAVFACCLVAGTIALSACGGNLASSPALRSQFVSRTGGISKIQHVVIIIQENRTLNNLFMGYPGATTQSFGYLRSGKKVQLKPAPLEEKDFLLSYDLRTFITQCNGTGSIPGTNCQMNGFDKASWQCAPSGCPFKYPPYSYVPTSETTPYWDMAQQYVLADQMYASNLDESSFISHQYIIAAQAMQAFDYPSTNEWGCEGGAADIIGTLGPQRQFPVGSERVCFPDMSLGQEADEAGITWAAYSVAVGPQLGGGGWNGYQANQYVYDGPDLANDYISPPSQFLTDVANGKLRQITWITPTLTNSDHLGSQSNTGPSWVASLVNAIGQSQFWNSTAIFIFWDDPGGFYDPEPPAYVDYDGLGMRLPLLIISPYAKKGYVSHVHYEHGSILKFAEDAFGLPRLSASDKRAHSLADDAFDFNRPPRKFSVIPAPHGKDYFLRQPLDLRPPDTH